MRRVLKIEKFRNIGLEKTEQLVLNQSMEKGKMGNLVILIGANNSGKSNVLEALCQFTKKQFDERDVTMLSYEPANRIPSLALSTYDQSSEYEYKIKYNDSNCYISYPNITQNLRIDSDENNDKLCKFVVEQSNSYSLQKESKKFTSLRNIFSANNATAEEKIQAENELIKALKEIRQEAQNNYYSNIRYLWNSIVEKRSMFLLVTKVAEKEPSHAQIASTQYQQQFGVNFWPNIIKYVENPLSDNNFSIKYNSVGDDYFFKKVLKAINVKVEEVNNAYSVFRSTNNRGALDSFQNKINIKLKKLAHDFNKLYYVDDETYSFKMSFESENVYFYIMRNGEGMPLNYQSTGFKWFFNLYFNLLVDNELKAGDIIIMDEPATHLHVQGQYELRKFLKEFAIKNDITIVIATHSPFLIDMDYLDELRVISNDKNISSICNDFSTMDLDDPDSLKPIKESLTVKNYILTDPDKKVVFVEGITDYNYMIAFKKYFKRDDIIFLPIKGVGDGKSADIKVKQLEISKRLVAIRKNNPILMVDGDKAGYAMQKANKENSVLEVFTLKDVSADFSEIESLFTTSDAKKVGLLTDSGTTYIKQSNLSAVFKTYTDIEKTLSKTTIANFKKVFDYIENL